MTLATRCPACDTVFRVVQDQLKVADGWVRCGRCEAVFDAREALFDADAQGAATAGDNTAATTATDGLVVPPTHDAAPADSLPPSALQRASIEPAHAAADDPAAPPSAVADVVVAAAAPPDPRSVDAGPPQHGQPAVPLAEPPTAAAGVPRADGTPLLANRPADTPPFIRQADRRVRWHSLWARGLLAAAAAALLVLLAVQAAWPSRDVLAARWPVARPALDALCAAAGCRIEPPRRLDDLVVDSSSLTRAPSGSAVQLALVLRNRGTLAVAMPSADLTLTDVGGQPIARRVLAPAELRAASPTLAPGAQAALQTVLAFDGPAPSGYVLEIFYP